MLRRWRSFSLWAGRYLILDVRDKEAYDEGHIDGALHYPKTMLSRGSNELLPGAPPFATPATLAVVGGGVERVAVVVVRGTRRKAATATGNCGDLDRVRLDADAPHDHRRVLRTSLKRNARVSQR